MKQKTWYSRAGLTFTMVLILICTTAGAETLDRSGYMRSGLKKLEGTWRVQITVRNCATGAALGNAFPALASYAEGGTVTTVDSGFNPARRSPGLGVWQYQGGREYSALIEAFFFDAAGTLSGTHRLRQVIVFSQFPDELNVDISAEILAPNGSVVATGCATSVGRRLE